MCIVKKNGKRWTLYDGNGGELFTGKTRVSCFRYAFEHGLEIRAYQHGGK